MGDHKVDGAGRQPGGPGRRRPGRDGEDLSVVTERTVTDVVTGRIHVAAGGILILTGTAGGGVVVTHGGYARIVGHTEGLFVAIGGHAVLTGTCHGPAINDGGQLRIEGTVDGPLITQAGETALGPNASVTDMTGPIVEHQPPTDTLAVRRP